MSPEFVTSSSFVAPNACWATPKLPEQPWPLLQSLGFLPFGTVPNVCFQSITIGFGPDSPPTGTDAVQYEPPASVAADASTPLIVTNAFLPDPLVVAPGANVTYALTTASHPSVAKYGSGLQLLSPGGIETLPSSGGFPPPTVMPLL
jgi:hypothetical protein